MSMLEIFPAGGATPCADHLRAVTHVFLAGTGRHALTTASYFQSLSDVNEVKAATGIISLPQGVMPLSTSENLSAYNIAE